MTTSDSLSAQERAARERFILKWGVKRWGLSTAVAGALLFFWMQHQSTFRSSALISRDLAIILAIWLVVVGWFGGRRWGAQMYDWGRSRNPHGPPPLD